MPQFEPTVGEDLEVRLEHIESLIDKGLTQAQIVKDCLEREAVLKWGVTDRQIRNYYSTALQRMASGAGKIDRRQYHVKSLRRLEYIYSQAIANTNLKIALGAVREMIKLLHLDDPAHELDWQALAKEAGIDPQSALVRMLEAHQQLSAVENE